MQVCSVHEKQLPSKAAALFKTQNGWTGVDAKDQWFQLTCFRSASPLKTVPITPSTRETIAPAFPLPEPNTAPAEALKCTTLRMMAITPNDRAIIACVRFLLLPPALARARHASTKLMSASTPPTMDLTRPGVKPVTGAADPSATVCEHTSPVAKKESPTIRHAGKMIGTYFFIDAFRCKLIRLFRQSYLQPDGENCKIATCSTRLRD